ncbi:MAG: hypothetical protein JWP97_4087 [Labilithrix sp.]|nr:hypothetical protein [Labilithrix sp.]
MKPLVGLSLGGPVVRAAGAHGTLGEPAWSPAQLLRDLEMRLGLPKDASPLAQRVPAYARRLAAGPVDAFYRQSFAVDALGTARQLLGWRDALLEAGWDGRAVAGGGPRLAALAAIEALAAEGAAWPAGAVDRLVVVGRELRASSAHAIYEGLTLATPRALWPLRWRSVFALLEERGAVVTELATDFPGAAANTDLGLLQRLFRGEPAGGQAIVGDGTLLLLRGDTAGDLAELTAALLVKHRDDAVVVRCADPAPLEAALVRHGLPGQGHDSSSSWRPAMQILPLALELAYAPRDPYRVLELLTLPVGPFRGVLGARLARAVSRQPGVGGSEWVRQKEEARQRLARQATERGKDPDAFVAERMQRVTDWIEQPGHPEHGAPREALLAVVQRVRTFLQRRLGIDELRETYRAAHGQAAELAASLARDPRSTLSREDMRQLAGSVAGAPQACALSVEQAGRLERVDHPGALLAPARTVVMWSFVAGTERRPALQPWNRGEREALEAAGVQLVSPKALLAAESQAWRSGLLAARERVLMVVPSASLGSPAAPHPTWDEIAARLGLEREEAQAKITRRPTDILFANAGDLSISEIPALPLPEGRAAWSLPPGAVAAETLSTSATSLSSLASCPLRFVLSEHAKIRGGALARVSSGPHLNGSLGHRLVEELHRERAFEELDEPTFEVRARERLVTLLETEGATLLLAGASFERAQLVPQLVKAMVELRAYLVGSGWRIAAVEQPITTTSSIGVLHGRLDVRLVNDLGKEAVLDLKWGESSYRALLEEGRAVQLAAYVRGIHEQGSKHSLPPAAYFSLSNARVVTADARMGLPEGKTLAGATLAETWSRVERTARAVQQALKKGIVPVAATKKALPLLGALGISESEKAQYYALEDPEDACSYCDYSAICGKAWEGMR